MVTLRVARRESGQDSARELEFTLGDLRRVRALVATLAAEGGLGRRRADELTVVVNELAANSIDHGGGAGTLRAWFEPDALVVEVSDAGRIADPDALGRTAPGTDQARGRGLWIARRLADALEIRSGAAGTVACVRTWL
jgi:anti-sigma regulatory factor (Ser/Thr protein kinase)